MDNNNLIWLCEWYKKNCNSDWEHNYGIKIETLDNPGWALTIDIIGSTQENLNNMPWRFIKKNNDDWYGYKIEDGKFEASGDALKLNQLIKLFRDIVEK
ncbi:MAG: immunity 53 family protein [Chitinophagaceae bacterium]